MAAVSLMDIFVLDGEAPMSPRKKQAGMTAADFKRIALSLEGAEEGSHMGAVDFRVGGRIFATLASVAKGYFHSHEPNEPPHVHVDRDDQSAKFWLSPVALARNLGFSPVELREDSAHVKGK